jgi:hypothetical protein
MKAQWIVCTLWMCTFGVALAAPQQFIVGDVELVYRGTGAIVVETNQTASFNIFVTLPTPDSKNSLQLKTPRAARPLDMPYCLTVRAYSNKLSLLKANFGKGTTGMVYVAEAHDVKRISVKYAIVSLTTDTERAITLIRGKPGALACMYAPSATVRRIHCDWYVGNPDHFETPGGVELPPFMVQAEKINRIKVRYSRKRRPGWISQVYGYKLGGLRGWGVSHVTAEKKIRRIRSYNLTGVIQVGASVTGGVVATHDKGFLRRIRTGVIYNAYVLGGAPVLTNNTSSNYYDQVANAAEARVDKIRARTTQNTVIVSKRRVRIGTRRRPLYGENTELWENGKERKLNILPKPSKK